MKNKKLLISFILPVIIVACAQTPTKYGPMNMTGGLNTGYIDRKTDDNTYEIQVRGNAVTTYATLEDYFHQRATELCESSKYIIEISEEKNTVINDAVLMSPGGGIFSYSPTSIASFPFITGTVICEPIIS